MIASKLYARQTNFPNLPANINNVVLLQGKYNFVQLLPVLFIKGWRKDSGGGAGGDLRES